ncbi:MAG: hypothetical protein RL508_918 [Actinomycetota bacterium]|jgi:cytoplasmic iron level regulating protein YaaA (DUF328/UPF0246 family)
MLFLLPPSETKASGGGLLTIEEVALSFGGMNPARERVLDALLKLCKKPTHAAKALKLSPKQLGAVETNLAIRTAPTMRALERYTGTLFDAIEPAALEATHWQVAKERVLIQTALFGLLPATDLIPDYRLSANTVLPKLNLKEVWTEAHNHAVWPRLNTNLLIDLRSKAYAQLAPIPNDHQSLWVEVVSRESDGKLRALNHFNKLAKGLLIGAVLRAPKAPTSLEELVDIAAGIGMELHQSDGGLILVTDQIVKAKRA